MRGTGDATPSLDVADVARRFGTSWVLRGVTLDVHAGEVVGLMGANGSGKSTLLRIIATLLRSQHGSVRVCGHDVARAPHSVRACIGYLAHSPGLYDDLTARENLAFAATMLEREHSDVDRVLDRVGLSSAAGRQVRRMSAGMQRRVALARLILTEPRVLLLDEPYANLDPDGIALFNSLLAEWVSNGAAALIVLHERAPASGLLDRSLMMLDGRSTPMAEAGDAQHHTSGAPHLTLVAGR